ncbi:MAG: hypothetical protein AB1585_02535 [Thermodesulfobacteriota bacterium]
MADKTYLEYFLEFLVAALMSLVWLAYFSTLLGIEYTGYHILRIREVTSEPALCLGLIHGTPILKAYYLVAGLGAVFFNHFFKKAARFDPGSCILKKSGGLSGSGRSL